MKIGQLVRIGGRTRLSPTFSLVGLTGIVIPTSPGTPPGCVTVWVNWQEAGYENLDELPPAVNVPELHLEIITAEPEEEQKTPHLQSVSQKTEAASTRAQATKTPQPEAARDDDSKTDEDEPRPKLRLV